MHVDVIKNSLGLPTAEVESVIEGMLQDGLNFTTVDADTFDIIDYFLCACLIFQMGARESCLWLPNMTSLEILPV